MALFKEGVGDFQHEGSLVLMMTVICKSFARAFDVNFPGVPSENDGCDDLGASDY